jgi:spore coat protein CotH
VTARDMTAQQPRRSWIVRIRRRIPLRVRHHWPLLAACCAFLTVLTVVVGTVRVRPYVTNGTPAADGTVSVDITGTRDLFDAAVPHTMSLTVAASNYERMLQTYFDTGEKDWLEADLTLDGLLVPSVAIRLKGNSSLSGLTWRGQTRGFSDLGGGGGPGGFPGGGGGGRPGGGDFLGGGGVGRAALDAEQPETLPWLVDFDEFVEGRRYQGREQIAVRVGGFGAGTTAVAEAVALTLVRAAGEPTQRYAYASLSFNDRPAVARLIVEHPDGNFAERLGSDGVLYKSLATSQFTYQGEDPTAYQDDFKQINQIGRRDLQPVINLIKWANETSGADFAARLGDHIDVASFARYVALQNLLLNFDDMAGPGRNYFLWYDVTTRRFRILSWDYNLAFSGDAQQGPHDTGGMRGRGGVTPPDGFTPPEGMGPPPGGAGPAPGGGLRIGHVLKEKFLADAAFSMTYDDAYRDLYRKLYANGTAVKALDAIVTVLGNVSGAADADARTDADRLRSLITQRTASLATNEVIDGA